MTHQIILDPLDTNSWVTKINPYAPTNSPFFVNISDTPNAGDPARPNCVVNFGFNLNPGGGPVQPGDSFFGMGFEQHYAPGGGDPGPFNEWHIYMGTADGQQHRPDSMRLDKSGNGWTRMLRCNNFTLTAPEQTQPFMQWSPSVMSFLCRSGADGEPESGFSFSNNADAQQILINKFGPENLRLTFQGWEAFDCPGGIQLQDTGAIFFNGGYGQGFVGPRNGQFEVVYSTPRIVFGGYGGPKMVIVDTENGRVGLGRDHDTNDITDPRYNVHLGGTIGMTPAAATPVNNGDLTIEANSDTLLTLKYKGMDGVVRSGTISLS